MNRTRRTGWERYALGLAAALPEARVLGVGRRPVGPRTNQALALWWRAVELRRRVAAADVTLCHHPMYPPPRLAMPQTWTVHDAITLGAHRAYHRASARMWARFAWASIGWVTAVVTSSRAVADELVGLGVPAGRVHVVPPATAPLPSPTSAPPLTYPDGRPAAVPDRFALAVGTFEARKRLDVAAAGAHRAGLPLVVAGAGPAVPAGVLVARNVPDGQLAWLYAHAAVLVAASDYEGIDLPVLEARALGLPVAASDIPVHREFATDACLFAPGDPDAAADAIGRAVRAGPRPAARAYTWARTADAYRELWRHLVD